MLPLSTPIATENTSGNGGSGIGTTAGIGVAPHALSIVMPPDVPDMVATGAPPILVPRQRNPLALDAVAQVARRLFAHGDPTLPHSHVGATTRDIPHIYVDSIHKSLQLRLFHALNNRERLFVQGPVGVGTSVFTADYARAFNHQARRRGDPRRVARVSIVRDTMTVRHFLQALCDAVKAPLTDSEARTSSPRRIGQRILAQALRLRLSSIIIDHVHLASDPVRDAIADFMMFTDPTYYVDVDVEERCEDDNPLFERIGIILVDHNPPEQLFCRHVQVLNQLKGAHVELQPYTTVEQIAELLQWADIGLEDLNMADPEDWKIAERVLEQTNGLVTDIAGFLRIVDLLATMHGGCRPDLAIVEAAMPYHRRTMKLLRGKDPRTGHITYRTVAAAVPRRSPGGKGAEKSGKPGNSTPKGAGSSSRAKAIRASSDAKAIARAEGEDMRRNRKYAVLPKESPS